MLVSEENSRWVRERYPGLICDSVGIAGTIAFEAAYNAESRRFLILGNGSANAVGGLVLSSQFKISIRERDQKSYSALPALRVAGLDSTADRHFNQADKSACLCSPFEEGDFLDPSFDLRRYLEELVIPFLYGQAFYSAYRKWPWQEYSHGAVGLLESFADNSDTVEASECLAKLQTQKDAWSRIRSALLRDHIKGHTPCFCQNRDHIRRCHPRALRGVRLLQEKIKQLGITIS